MELAVLQGNADRLAAIQTKWEDRCNATIASATDRAYVHGIKALTDRLKSTPDGRATIRHALRSPSYGGVVLDLNALLVSLAGSSRAATAGLVRDAREAMYRQSFRDWMLSIGPVHALPLGTEPTSQRIAMVRGYILHGYDLRNWLQPKFNAAKANLLALLERASKQGTLTHDGIDLIDGWHDSTRSNLIATVATCLGDSAVALASLAAVDAVKPEFRPADGIAPE